MIHARRLAMAGLAMVLAGCTASSGPGQASVMAGTWTYTGTRDTPNPASIDGSGTLAAADGGFEGTFTITERATSGSVVTLAATVAGRVVADSVADFDLTVQGVARRHVGVLRGDSVSGSWASAGSASNASGRFVLRRVRP
jgi:hypothetical protein